MSAPLTAKQAAALIERGISVTYVVEWKHSQFFPYSSGADRIELWGGAANIAHLMSCAVADRKTEQVTRRYMEQGG